MVEALVVMESVTAELVVESVAMMAAVVVESVAAEVSIQANYCLDGQDYSSVLDYPQQICTHKWNLNSMIRYCKKLYAIDNENDELLLFRGLYCRLMASSQRLHKDADHCSFCTTH